MSFLCRVWLVSFFIFSLPFTVASQGRIFGFINFFRYPIKLIKSYGAPCDLVLEPNQSIRFESDINCGITDDDGVQGNIYSRIDFNYLTAKSKQQFPKVFLSLKQSDGEFDRGKICWDRVLRKLDHNEGREIFLVVSDDGVLNLGRWGKVKEKNGRFFRTLFIYDSNGDILHKIEKDNWDALEVFPL